RDLLDVRASHAAVLRQGACRLHPRRAHRRAVEDPARGRGVRAPPAGAGAAHGAGRAGAAGRRAAARRGGDRRVLSPLHDDAGRGEAELEDRDLRDARDLPRGPAHAGRVPAAHHERPPAPRMSAGAAGEAPLAGRTALVTGASRGIGREVALRLATAGARVWGAGRSAEALETLAAETGGASLVVDLTDDVEVWSAADRLTETLGGPP